MKVIVDLCAGPNRAASRAIRKKKIKRKDPKEDQANQIERGGTRRKQEVERRTRYTGSYTREEVGREFTGRIIKFLAEESVFPLV